MYFWTKMDDELKNNVYGEIITISYITFIILLSIPFYKINSEYSRKVIHIMLGNFYFIALYYFTKWYFASFFPFLFIFINYFSIKHNLIKYMQKMPNPKDKSVSYGTVYYAISLFILTTFSWIKKNYSLGLCPFLAMAYGDGLACIFGGAFKSRYINIYDSKKSIIGSSTMFIVCFLVFGSYLNYMNINCWMIKSFILSSISTLLEAISPCGIDNLTVPLGGLVLMNYLL